MPAIDITLWLAPHVINFQKLQKEINARAAIQDNAVHVHTYIEYHYYVHVTRVQCPQLF